MALVNRQSWLIKAEDKVRLSRIIAAAYHGFRDIVITMALWLVAPAYAQAPPAGAISTTVAPVNTYSPWAVTFAPEVNLSTSGAGPNATGAGITFANGLGDTGYGIHSMCLKGTIGSPTSTGNDGNWTLYNNDIITNYGAPGQNTSESVPGDNLAIDGAGGSIGTWRYNLGDAANNGNGGGVSGHAVELALANAIIPGAFDCYLWAHSITRASGQKHMVVYRNGVQIAYGAGETGTVGAIVAKLTNPKGWGINALSGNGPAGSYGGGFDVADIFIDWHIPTDKTGANWLTYLETYDRLPVTTVAAFWDPNNNRPMDPYNGGVWSGTPLGGQPDILFSGTKASFGTNKGSVTNAFVLGGPDAAPHVLYDAPVGPTGPLDGAPYLKWTPVVNHLVTTGGPGSFTISNNLNPIVLGDLLVLIVQSSENSSVNRDFGSTLLTNGWARLGALYVPDGSNYPQNSATFYKFAAVGDVTLSRSSWLLPPTISIGNNSTGMRSLTWHLLDFGQASAIAYQGSVNPSSVNVSAPSMNYFGPSLLVNAYCAYEPSYAGLRKQPAAQNLRWKQYGASGYVASCIIADEKFSGSGTTGARVATQANARVSSGISLIITP